MLRIVPIQDKIQQQEMCNLCGITYLPDAFAYAALVSGTFVGMSQFGVCDEYGTVYNIAPAPDTDDLEALFIMGRQTMNWIDLLGLHTCHCREDAASEKLIRLLGFTRNEKGELTADMTHMFDGHCGGNCNFAKELQED